MTITNHRLGIGLAILAVAGSIAIAALAGGTGERGLSATAAGKAAPQLKVKGKVGRLTPGKVKKIRVRVRNEYPRTVRLGFVKARARTAAPGCVAKNVKVTPKRGKLRKIPSRKTRVVKLKIAILATAPDACQGARFPLVLKAKGSQL